MTERRITCRYLRRNGDQCTAEALDPEGEVLVCTKHAARVLDMVRSQMAKDQARAEALELVQARTGRTDSRG